MLRKLAEIAEFADNSKHHEFADNTTKLLKEAQLWDALRTLFDPEHTPGVDRNTPFWKRLSKGWSRGKMDRNLGLVLAIMTERTKLNEKINSITAPIKSFQDELAAFYDKMKSGQIKSDNFKDEARNLQKGLKETLNTISNKDLRNILKMRERLEAQQLVAAEKIKGLDEETKTNLMSVLRGESLPGVRQEQIPGQLPPGVELSDIKQPFDVKYVPPSLRRWLNKFNLPRISMYSGAQTPSGKHNFREFMEEYGYHPKAVYDFFASNTNAQGEGFDRFGKYFGEMLRRAPSIMEADKRIAEEGGKSSVAPAAAPAPAASEPLFTDPMIVPPAVEKQEDVTAPNPELEKEIELKHRQEEEKQKERDLLKALQEREQAKHQRKNPVVLPEIPQAPLATSKAERVAREITRLGRVRKLNKLAGEGDDFATPGLFGFKDRFNFMMGKQDDVSSDDPDIYEANPEGRERFDEEKHFDPEEVEYFKGRKSDEDYYDEAYPLTPEDDDYIPERPEPKLLPASPQEELAELMSHIRNVDKNIERLLARTNPDNQYGDSITLNRLHKEKKLLEDAKNKLIKQYNLPPDF